MVQEYKSLEQLVSKVMDFPVPGVHFKDINPLLRSPQALQQICEDFSKKINFSQIDLIAGIESRGFILGTLLSSYFKKGFVPLRKAGKLPPPVCQKSYSLEYGKAILESQYGQGNMLIMDDVLATGGTLQAAIELATQAGFNVVEVAVLINLKSLNQMKFNNKQIISLIDYE